MDYEEIWKRGMGITWRVDLEMEVWEYESDH